MGQAKQRGTRQERVEAAVERDKAVELARERKRIAVTGPGIKLGRGMALGSIALAFALTESKK